MSETQTHPPLSLETVVSRRQEIIDSALSETEAVMLNIDQHFPELSYTGLLWLGKGGKADISQE